MCIESWKVERFYRSLYQNLQMLCKLLIDNKYYNPMRVTYKSSARLFSCYKITIYFIIIIIVS